jgi:hypothetical protein
METLPERVVFDTSRPSIAPPPSVTSQTLPTAFTFEQITPGLLSTFSNLAEIAQVTPKKTVVAKREPAKKVVTNRVAPQAPIAAAKNHPVREAEQDTKPLVRTTLLDDIAGRFGKLFKTN